MTGKQRILTVLNGGIPDRVPVSLYKINPFDTNSFWAQHQSFKRLLETAKETQDTFQFYKLKTGFFFSSPDAIEIKVEETEDTSISHTVKLTVETELGPLTRSARTTRLSCVQWVQKPWIEDHLDIEKFLSLPYISYKPDLSDFYQLREELGDRGIMVIALPDPLGVIGILFAPGDFAKAALENRSITNQLLEKIHERLVHLYSFISENVENAIIRIRGAEYATSPSLPVEYFHDIKRAFSEFVLKYDRELIEILRNGRKNFICYHWHGHIDKLLPLVLKMRPDIIEPICNGMEIPNTILKIRRIVGNNITLMGGILSEDMEFNSKEDINGMVKESILQGAKNGRFILIPSGVPNSTPLSPIIEENYIEFLKAGAEYGPYPIG